MPDPGKKKRKPSRLVVGLDFGTTHTGISFAMTGSEITLNIDKWPAYDGSMTVACKTPTHISYTSGGSPYRWGYQIESNANLCAWMKYHLDQDSPKSQYDDPELKQAMKNGLLSIQGSKSPEQVTTDYLREVFKFTVAQLKDKFGARLLRATSINWWLAKPAIWGGQAEIRLQKIVETAANDVDFGGIRGGDDFHFISEPEAAAFSLLGDAEESKHEFKTDSSILVLDCGGGTVDVAVYTIVSTSPDIKFEEVVRGQGGKCGAAYLDRLFQDLMLRRFGFSYSSVKREEKMTGSKFMSKFEINKQRFGSGDPLIDMPLRMFNVDESLSKDNKYYHPRDGQVKLTEDDMKNDIFAPLIENIINMITEQAMAAQDAIPGAPIANLLLVGGLGRSPYLQSHIRKWCDREDIKELSHEEGITLRIPESKKSWGAVSYGAVLRGLDRAKIETRIARFHYGIECSLPYDRRRDPLEDMYLSPFTGAKLAKNCVLWFVKAGSVIGKDPIVGNKSSKLGPQPLRRELKKGQSKFSEQIVSCGAEKAPRKKTSEVQNVGRLDVDLSEIDLEVFTVTAHDRTKKIRFDYKVQQGMGAQQGSLLFKAVTLDGKELGHSQIDIRSKGPSESA